MTKTNVWNEALGPFYDQESVQRLGITATADLITLTTSDGVQIMPSGQFEVADDGRLQRREPVISIWNELIQPAIDDGTSDEWSATVLLLQAVSGDRSPADTLVAPETTPEDIAAIRLNIRHRLARWRQ